MRKYSCSGADGGEDLVALVWPKSWRMRMAWALRASMLLQERGLLVECFAGPTEERGGDDQGGAVGMLHDVGGAGGVPGGVAARLEGGAKTAGGKAAGIRFALDQFLTAEDPPGRQPVGREETVMLLGGDAGHRLEQMGIVGGAMFHCPIAHGGGDRIGDGGIEWRSLVNGPHEALVGRLGQAGLHFRLAEDIGPENVLQMDGLEVHIGKLVLGQGDRLDRLLASIRHGRWFEL